MDLWLNWVDVIRQVLEFLATDVGFGLGLSIIALTIGLRLIVLPLTWSTTYRGQVRQKRLARLQPELLRIKERHADDPRAQAERTLELYRKHGLSLFDGRTLAGALVQLPILLGMFHALREGLDKTRFLWVANLAKPDLWLAILAGLTTALLMAAAPDMPDQVRLLLLVVPAIVMVVVGLKFASALGLYWATSNLFTASQTAAVRYVVARRIDAGSLRI